MPYKLQRKFFGSEMLGIRSMVAAEAVAPSGHTLSPSDQDVSAFDLLLPSRPSEEVNEEAEGAWESQEVVDEEGPEDFWSEEGEKADDAQFQEDPWGFRNRNHAAEGVGMLTVLSRNSSAPYCNPY